MCKLHLANINMLWAKQKTQPSLILILSHFPHAESLWEDLGLSWHLFRECRGDTVSGIHPSLPKCTRKTTSAEPTKGQTGSPKVCLAQQATPLHPNVHRGHNCSPLQECQPTQDMTLMGYNVERGTHITLATISHRHSESDDPATTGRASTLFCISNISDQRMEKKISHPWDQPGCLLLLMKMPGKMEKEHLAAGDSSQEP